MWLNHDGTIQISAKNLGALALPDFCRRCFWIKLRLKTLPFATPFPGIFSSLDKYTKDVVHAYFDRHGRLPEYLSSIGKDINCYVTGEQLHWRRYRYLDPETKILLTGMPDDIFTDGKARGHHTVDYKTAKFTGKQDELFPVYEIQLNGYAFIGERSGTFRPMKSLTLVYYEPLTDEVASNDWRNWAPRGFKLDFTAKLLPVDLDLDKIPPLLHEVREISRLKKPPIGASGCKDCVSLGNLWCISPRAPDSELVALLAASLRGSSALARGAMQRDNTNSRQTKKSGANCLPHEALLPQDAKPPSRNVKSNSSPPTSRQQNQLATQQS
jgi:hypothetical protein